MLRGISTPVTLVTALGITTLVAAKSAFGEACDQSNTHLDGGSFQLVTDCNPTLYCADNSTCAYKGCRRDTYPFGYNDYAYDQLPPLCPEGQFCPDEGDQCRPQVPIGQRCQKDRDDECERPPNYRDLAGYLNTNGTICLSFTCYLANVTLGQTCVNDNTPYTAYNDNGDAYAFIVSRDDCANGLYCDATELRCMKNKAIGATCSGNKECLSYNCEADGRCGKAADAVIHPPAWQYVLIGLGIVVLIGGVMTGLWLMHRRTRKENQIKLEQYYNEQIAYRQSIMSMSHAKNSLLSLPPNTTPDYARQSLYRDDAAWSSATDPSLIPPNMRRDSVSGWSDTDKPSDMARADSEVLLMPDQRYSDAPESSRRPGNGREGW
ncbi:hypothetical protein IAR55_005124 [Kwoniella newhampshirensis]|uniref:Uncharacterized protein n=1 Tax=Kwoniella newhampshirensis TaxID=1651941 RepID=A0AAW0YUX2_9TREE